MIYIWNSKNTDNHCNIKYIGVIWQNCIDDKIAHDTIRNMHIFKIFYNNDYIIIYI